MKQAIQHFLKKEGKYALSAFFIPFFIMFFAYLSIGIYWGSSRSVLASDAFSQFSNFHASFRNVLHGEQSIFYTWNASLGLNYWSLISYYLGGIFTPLVFFFKNESIPDALYLLTLLKIGSAGLAFWVYAKETFIKNNPWLNVALSVSYSLMSFVTAHSELIMWLDSFIYLPLVILGINQILSKGKSVLLFVSYLLLFLSNFYFGFMIGVFSVLYYAARVFIEWPSTKKTIIPYFTTSFLAGISSMIMILPAYLDLKKNGESLTEITKFKTAATGPWDIIAKNMIGVFDTTKYGSIPFIYVGLVPFLFCLYYFITKQIPWRNKIAFGSIFLVLIASFYIDPLNLFWHGMHAPNMFLFRYSFLFSFLVVMLAGYGLETYSKHDPGDFIIVSLLSALLFILSFTISGKQYKDFINLQTLVITLSFVLIYLLAIAFFQLNKLSTSRLAVVLLLLMSGEAFVNTTYMVNGILDDWNYASRSLYSAPYTDYKHLVDSAQISNKKDFYRLESLAPVSSNDAFNYGYSGISMFSSMRNRHSSSLMNTLGYRSRGTNLNIRYQNNTLFMDSLMGIKHNISDQDVKKFGFNQVDSAGKYQLYDNQYALPLGVLTDKELYGIELDSADNLGSQTAVINQLAQLNESYFSFVSPQLADSKNTTIVDKPNNHVSYQEIKPNIAKEITYDVFIPAGNQAYVSLFPDNFNQLKSSTVTVSSKGTSYKTQLNITGQYHNLGYFDEDATVRFTLSFYGTKDLDLINPTVMLMDTLLYQTAMRDIQGHSVDFKVDKRQVTAAVAIPEDQTILTTIPYDKGWSTYIDGKKVPTTQFQDGLITIDVPKGEHHIKLSFLPQGLILGSLCFVLGISGFVGYYVFALKPSHRTKKKRRSKSS